MCWRPQTSGTHIWESRWFESMYTLQGKIWYTWHVRFLCQSMYDTRIFSVGNPRTRQPFASHQQRWTNPTTPEKKGSRHNLQHVGWPIHKSVTRFLSQDNNWSSNKSQTSVNNKLHQFTGPITPATIGTFNTCSRGPTHRSLTDTGGGYNLGGASLP
jgi:hypothetical protein